MLYKQLIELFDILDSASASGAQVVEYFRSIVPDCQVETYPLEGPKGHTDMVRILIPGRNGRGKAACAACPRMRRHIFLLLGISLPSTSWRKEETHGHTGICREKTGI